MSTDDASYSRVSSRFWAEAADEGWTVDMCLMGLYLLTCQARTTEGLYRLPLGYMAEDLPGEWPTARLTQTLEALIGTGFVQYDERARVVLLPKAMKYQRPDNANQQKAAIRKLKSMPATTLWGAFMQAAQTYCEPFHKRLQEAFPKGLAKGLAEGLQEGLAEGYAKGEPEAIPQGYRDSLALALALAQAQEPPLPPTDTGSACGYVDKLCTTGQGEERDSSKTAKGKGKAGARKSGAVATGSGKESACSRHESAPVAPPEGGWPPASVLLCGAIRKLAGVPAVSEYLEEGTRLNLAARQYVAAIHHLVDTTFADRGAQTIVVYGDRCTKAAFDQLVEYHSRKPIEDLPAFLSAKQAKAAHLGDLVGDSLVDELRREGKRKGSTRRLAEVLGSKEAT